MGQPSQRDSRNLLLASLPETEYRRLTPHLKKVSLRGGQILHESGAPAQDVYFLDEGVASLSVSGEDGRGVGLSIVGNESVVGERAIYKEGFFIIRCQMLTEGSGYKMAPEVFHEEFDRGGALHDLVLSRMEARITESAQTALCNSLHTVEQRLSRWLLTFADRLHGEELRLTQEHMADILGVRRATITEEAVALREAGLIEYVRGSITIENRAGLEDRACECYQVIKESVEVFTRSKPQA
jgi:CRP-like cAMP-binding protein